MAGIDWIMSESNAGLIKLYEYLTNVIYVKHSQTLVNYHPDYKYSSVCKYVDKWHIAPYMLYSSTSQFVLNEILRRWDESENFSQECWWASQAKLFSRISVVDEKKMEIYRKEILSRKTEKVDTYIEYNGSKFKLIGTGSKRKVYLSDCGTFVIKIPHIDIGYKENKEEVEIYLKNPDGNYAQCWLMEDGNLRMEYVKPVYFTNNENIPEWVYTIAEAQVGYNKSGKLVAYDYGSKI